MEIRKWSKKKRTTIAAAALAAALIIIYVIFIYTANPAETDVLLREYPVSRGDITAGIDGAGGLARIF